MRFIACLNDGRHINIQADRMAENEDMLRVYADERMVAVVDVAAVVCAYLSERSVIDSGRTE